MAPAFRFITVGNLRHHPSTALRIIALLVTLARGGGAKRRGDFFSTYPFRSPNDEVRPNDTPGSARVRIIRPR
jgi:hypothetical protein